MTDAKLNSVYLFVSLTFSRLKSTPYVIDFPDSNESSIDKRSILKILSAVIILSSSVYFFILFGFILNETLGVNELE